MEAWQQEALKLTLFIGLLGYLWRDFKGRMEKAMESFTASLSQKADKNATTDLKNDLQRQIEKIEERQIREVEGLRTEMGDLRTHLDRRFDQLVGMLQK